MELGFRAHVELNPAFIGWWTFWISLAAVSAHGDNCVTVLQDFNTDACYPLSQ